MSEREYRQDDVIGRGYCPRCYRSMSVDTALFGVCEEHGRVPADFARPTGWRDPDATFDYLGPDRNDPESGESWGAYEPTDPKHPDYHDLMSDLADM